MFTERGGDDSRDTGKEKIKTRGAHTWETQTQGTAVGEGLMVDAKQWFGDFLLGKNVKIEASAKMDPTTSTIKTNINFPAGIKAERDDIRSTQNTLIYYVTGKDPETGKNVIRAIALDTSGLNKLATSGKKFTTKLYGKVYDGMDKGAFNTMSTFLSELNRGKKFYAKSEVIVVAPVAGATSPSEPRIKVNFPAIKGVTKIERDDDPRRTNRNQITFNITGTNSKGLERTRAVVMDISRITGFKLAPGTYHTMLIGQTYEGE